MHPGTGLLLIVLVVCALLYFLPSVIGSRRQLSSGRALFLVNLFFGWTLVGWLFCMLWAAVGATRGQDAYFRDGRPLPPNPMDDPAFRDAYARERARLDHEAGR